MDDIFTALDWIQKGGVTAFFVIILLGGRMKWWVFGWVYEEVEKDRDYWKGMSISLKGMLDAEQVAHREHYLIAHGRRED